MHHQVRNEAAYIEAIAHVLVYVCQQRVLHQFGFVRQGTLRGFRTPWPSIRTVLWKTVVVDHRGNDAVSILMKMASYIAPHRVPTPDSTAMVALPCISDQPSTDH